MDHEQPGTDPTARKKRLGFRVLEMRTFWVSHLTTDGNSIISRGLSKAIRTLAEGEVLETPSFYVFQSFATIDRIAFELRWVRRIKDGFLVGSFTHSECRIVGPCDDILIADLVPYAKRLGQGAPNAKPTRRRTRD